MPDFAAARTTMVDCQVRPNDVTKYPIIDALLTIPREDFVPATKRTVAYIEDHLPLAPGRVLLDARSFAKMLDALNIQPDDLVLDIGGGMGYSAAVIARMAEAVICLESDDSMAEDASSLLASNNADNVWVECGPLEDGAANLGPYNAIIIEGGVEEVPDTLLEQLRDGGRIAAIFVGDGAGHCRIGTKSGGSVHWRNAFAAHAPLLAGFSKTRSFAFG